ELVVSPSQIVLQIERKALRAPELWQCGRRECEHHRVLDLAECSHRAAGDGLDARVRSGALVPISELHERDTGVLSAAAETEALHREHGFDGVFLVGQEMLLDLLDDAHRPRLRRADRTLDL